MKSRINYQVLTMSNFESCHDRRIFKVFFFSASHASGVRQGFLL